MLPKNRYYNCTCDFCQRDDADEIRKRTVHITPNYSVTAIPFPPPTQVRKKTPEKKTIKERSCILCQEGYYKVLKWFENLLG